MKLKNKKTGEIVYATMMASYGGGELQIRYYPVNNAEDTQFKEYRSISELNEEWCDYKEPKGTYFINTQGDVQFWDSSSFAYPDDWTKEKEIGNYFETKEEAEKAVEKLKAFANLRKRGLKFNGWDEADRGMVGEFAIYCDVLELDGIERELEIVFGREEL